LAGVRRRAHRIAERLNRLAYRHRRASDAILALLVPAE
jgi:hypothetical protein